MSEAANRLTDETPFGARVFVAETLGPLLEGENSGITGRHPPAHPPTPV